MVEVINPFNLRLNDCFLTTWKMATYLGTKILLISNTCLLPTHLHQQGINPTSLSIHAIVILLGIYLEMCVFNCFWCRAGRWKQIFNNY